MERGIQRDRSQERKKEISVRRNQSYKNCRRFQRGLRRRKACFFFNINGYGALFRIWQRGLPNPYRSSQSYCSVIQFPARILYHLHKVLLLEVPYI
jgi:hypothetical protein